MVKEQVEMADGSKGEQRMVAILMMEPQPSIDLLIPIFEAWIHKRSSMEKQRMQTVIGPKVSSRRLSW